MPRWQTFSVYISGSALNQISFASLFDHWFPQKVSTSKNSFPHAFNAKCYHLLASNASMYVLSNNYECQPCNLDGDDDVLVVDVDADGDGDGTCDGESSLFSFFCLWVVNCGTSKENNFLKNSYDAKKSAPWDIYITNLGINALKRF